MSTTGLIALHWGQVLPHANGATNPAATAWVIAREKAKRRADPASEQAISAAPKPSSRNARCSNTPGQIRIPAATATPASAPTAAAAPVRPRSWWSSSAIEAQAAMVESQATAAWWSMKPICEYQKWADRTHSTAPPSNASVCPKWRRASA